MQINNFQGISNTSPARSIPDNALADAVDVIIDDNGVIIQRDGYSQVLSIPITNSYQTIDGTVYIVSNDILYRMNDDLTKKEICPCTATEFSDFSRFLFTNDGWVVHENTLSNINIPCPLIEPDLVITGGNKPAGRYIVVYTYKNNEGVESGTSPMATIILDQLGDILVSTQDIDGYTANVYMSDADGEVLYRRGTRYPIKPILINADRFPANADKIEYHKEQLYISERMGDYSLIWYSVKLHYHLFGRDDKYLIIPGHVEAMASINEGLLIATNAEIYIYDGASLNKLANYGVIAGRSMVKQADGTVLIYTQRGVCLALPFTPLTESKVSLPMGSQCTTVLMYKHGVRSFIALHNYSGSAFNKT
jgi:hypothetical protein